MSLPFSPRDVISGEVGLWLAAGASDVTGAIPGEVDVWKDKHGGLFPLESAAGKRPLLSQAPLNLLNGRPTIALDAGDFLRGSSAWGAYSYSVNQYETSRRIPANERHLFIVTRFYPPVTAVNDSALASLSSSQGWNRAGHGLKPAVWMPPLDSYNECGLDIYSWNPSDRLAPGTLRFSDSMAYTFKAGYTMDPVLVPFSRWGQWVILEIVQRPLSSQLLIDGLQVANVPWVRPNPSERLTYHEQKPSLFSASSLSGTPASSTFAKLANGGGNVAEIIFFKGDLTEDDCAKTRAWLAQKWGLTPQLPAGAPYKSGVILGSNPSLPWAFPGLTPSACTYTPGTYANTAFGSIGGVERRVRHSRLVYGGDRLLLTFNGLSELEVGGVLDHYALCQGGFKVFALRPETIVNLGTVASHLRGSPSRAERVPTGASWLYAGEPQVQNLQLNINTLSVELELVPEPYSISLRDCAIEVSVTSDAQLIAS